MLKNLTLLVAMGVMVAMASAMTAAQAADVTLKRAGHPRLTMTPDELKRLQADENAVRTASEAGEDMLRKTKTTSYTDCFATLPAPPMPAPHPYNKAWPYWTGVCSELRSYLETLARGWAVGRNAKCRDAAVATMKSIAGWQQWTDPEYGALPCLDTFSLTRGMALSYDLLYPDLMPEDRALVQKAILEKGVQFIYTSGQDEKSFVSQPKAWPNGFAVVNTAMGIGGLALMGDVPDAGKYVTAALAKMEQFFREVAGADGGLVEGFMYGSFAVDNFTDLILQAHDVCGIDALKGDYLEHAILFPAYFTLPGGGANALPAIGDNGNINGLAPTLIGLAQALVKVRQDPTAAWYLVKAGHADSEAQKLARAPENLPLGRRFSSIEWVALRDNWGDGGALVAFKCGTADHHNHLDQNGFVVGWDSEWIIADPGYQIYDMDYPPERKMDRKAIRNMHVYTAGTEGHSSILVDGEGQNGKAGHIAEFFSSEALQWAVGDATACYEAKLTRFRRSIAQLPGRYTLVYDDVVAKAPAQIEAKLHTTPDANIEVDGAPLGLDATSPGRSFVIRRGKGQVAVDLLAPATTTLTNRQWPDSAAYGRFVTLTTDKATAQEDAFVLRPGPAGAAVTPQHAAMTSLAGRARSFEIGADTVIVNPDGVVVTMAALTTDAKAALSSTADGVLRYAVVEGTKLVAGHELVMSDVPVSAGVVVSGKTMKADIVTAQAATVTLYCPLKPGYMLLDGIEDPVDMSVIPEGIRLTLAAGTYHLRVREL